MESLIIEGGRSLSGTISVSGSKNAALPLLMASILFDGSMTYMNVPNLIDIRTTAKLLEILGRPVSFHDGIMAVKPGILQPEAPYELVKTMRASVLALGPLLACLGEAKVALPGGCAIGARPVDLHLKALERMGASFDLNDGYIVGRCEKLKGAKIRFDFPTVGGTENLMMAAVLADGETILENAAREPEIIDLAECLISGGAQIEGHGTSVIHIQGVTSLKGGTYTVIPDRIEAGTFIAAAGITGGELILQNCPMKSLEAVIAKFEEMGMMFSETPHGILAKCGGELHAVDVVTRPFPGFPTDMQAQIMALMCIAAGAGSITETIFENRFMHVPELMRMGADIRLSGHTAMIRGVSRLKGAHVMASDLRASASLVLAGLAAGGRTVVQRIYHLDRGYDALEKKLAAVGADIRRVQAACS